MTFYLSFTLGKLDKVRGRPVLALFCVFVMIGGLVLSFGIGGYTRTPFNTKSLKESEANEYNNL